MIKSNSAISLRDESSNDNSLPDQLIHWNNLRDSLNFHVSVLRHLMEISCSVTDDIDWVCEERQWQRYFTTEKNLDQYRGFLPNLINENGLREVVNSMWKMIPWLSYLRLT